VKFDEGITLVEFDIITQVAFGIEFNALEEPHGEHREFLERTSKVLAEMLAQSGEPTRKFSSVPEAKQLPIERKRVIELVRKFRSQSKGSIVGAEGGKGLSELIDSVEGLTEDERLANFFIFVLGGYDTTAHALAFTMHNLLTHPEIMKRCVAEVDANVQGTFPDSQEIPRLEYVLQCFKESVRMYPTGNGTVRELTETKTINDVTLAKGTMVCIFSVAVNYNPKVWKDPFKFNPDRFTKENEAARPKASNFSFSYGPRDCIGRMMAYDTAMIVLGALLKRYTIELAPNYQFVFYSAWSTRPLNDLLLHFKRRE